jgi:hypothetical protein
MNGLSGPATPGEYRGGIEDSGLKTLRGFLQGGGSVIALGQSSGLLMDRLSAPYKDGLRGLRREEFYCPGSLLKVQVDPSQPIGYGMKEEVIASFANSMALEPVQSFSGMQPTVIARFPTSDILKSGWLQGESHLYNKIAAADVRLGKGRMILMPLRVQNRAQTYGTFKLLFNAILTAAAEPGPE